MDNDFVMELKFWVDKTSLTVDILRLGLYGIDLTREIQATSHS